jgi:undecaprenyl-diphosphatase
MGGRDVQFEPSSPAGEGRVAFGPTGPRLRLRLHGGPLYASLICLAATFGFLMFRLDAQAAIDHPLILALNQFARRWPALDLTAVVFEEFNLAKGGLIFALAAAAFAVCSTASARAQLAAGCVAAALAAVASRAGQLLLPNIPRPLFDPALHFTLPLDADVRAMHDWSSFPSDNAALLFGVALAVWFADRRIGVPAFLVFVVGALARVYGGLHYPTDMLGGAALSAACVFAARSIDFGFVEGRRAFFHRYRAVWAALAFLFAFQAASLFDDVRAIAVLLSRWS